MKLASAFDQSQDSCLDDGSGGWIALTWYRLVLLLKLTFGPPIAF